MSLILKNYFQEVNIACFRKKSISKGQKLLTSCHVSDVREERQDDEIFIKGTVLRETPGATSTKKNENLY